MNRHPKKPLVLLLGNYRPSLILARKLSRAGFEVMVTSAGCEQLCQYSNSVSSTWHHSALENGADVFASELRSLSEQNSELVAIIPVSEEYVRFIAENEIQFVSLPHIVSVDGALISKCLNKRYMLQLANSTGVPTAPFAYPTRLSETLSAGNRSVRYPMIIRPEDSTKRIGGNKAICVNNDDELIKCYNKHDLHDQTLLVQRKFEGKRHNVYFAAVGGKVTRLLHAVIDRTDKPDGTGLAVDGRTLDADHPIVIQTKKLLSALNYTGIGCAQFLVNGKTGETSFLEINPRIAGNHAVPEYVGMDLTWFMVDGVLTGQFDEREIVANGGLRYCWTTGDLMGAKDAFMRKEIGLFSLVLWVARAAVTAIRSDLHMVYDRKDAYPAFRGMWKVIPRLARWRKPASPVKNIPSLTN